ncbi:DUF488 domain-containing protein [Edaphobacillus lindanitolerans]|uniref:DUF488 domain-containing protein n=1 Tax=Edaphobacillus lindanitolerans TaxID=550447 RepID=A0A1U7PPA6_9BACI|nr:DUF488 domain-containing protein [Edaphobacillus lindanitolerans]SIT79653.1 Protein of unknown function, DUF488 [Edaphobacillus lindanitolerans]
MDLYTIGHSTHTEDQFIKLLKDAGVELLADVRAFPGSRKFPWFHTDRMKEWLPENGIGYVHIPELGGRRRKSRDVPDGCNAGWNNRSLHNYADYTLEPGFSEGLRKLSENADGIRAAICCSERHPARCHRLLISNWVSMHGMRVIHILDGPHGETITESHEPGRWGARPLLQEDGSIIYPPDHQDEEEGRTE